jgi:hypothetical protein
MGHNRGQLPPEGCQPLPALQRRANADGLQRLSGRIPPQAGGTPNQSSCRRADEPAHLGKPGCPFAATPAVTAGHPLRQEGHTLSHTA